MWTWSSNFADLCFFKKKTLCMNKRSRSAVTRWRTGKGQKWFHPVIFTLLKLLYARMIDHSVMATNCKNASRTWSNNENSNLCWWLGKYWLARLTGIKLSAATRPHLRFSKKWVPLLLCIMSSFMETKSAPTKVLFFDPFHLLFSEHMMQLLSGWGRIIKERKKV